MSLTTSPLFSTRDSLEEAHAYAMEIVNTLPAEHRIGVLTAINVLTNTAISEINRLDLTSVLPVPLDDLPRECKLSEIPREKLQVMIRTLLAPTISELHTASRLPILGELTEGASSFTAMVAVLFGVPSSQLVEEVKAFLNSQS